MSRGPSDFPNCGAIAHDGLPGHHTLHAVAAAMQPCWLNLLGADLSPLRVTRTPVFLYPPPSKETCSSQTFIKRESPLVETLALVRSLLYHSAQYTSNLYSLLYLLAKMGIKDVFARTKLGSYGTAIRTAPHELLFNRTLLLTSLLFACGAVPLSELARLACGTFTNKSK